MKTEHEATLVLARELGRLIGKHVADELMKKEAENRSTAMIKKGVIDENTPPDQPHKPDEQSPDGTDKLASDKSPVLIDHPSTRAAEAAKQAQQQPKPTREPEERA